MKFASSAYLEYLSIALLSIFLIGFPLVFTSLTTDSFILPKQILLIGTCLLVLLLLGFKTIFDKTVRIRRTPFDLPIFLFLVATFLSSVLSVNRAESLVAFATLFLAGLLYFLFTNTAKSPKATLILTAAFLEGSLISGVYFILSFFKIYILPFSITRSQTFTSLGSLLDLAIYTSVALVFAVYLIVSWKKREKPKLKKMPTRFWVIAGLFGIKALVLSAALCLTLYSLVKIQKPLILPFDTGFQVSFAAISQDTTRSVLSFLLGSGFGTFAADFSRFKLSVFNQTPLWNLTFFRSSSFVLELLATTGILGLLSYLYLVYKILKTKPLFVPFAFFVLLSFVLPFSSTIVVLLFILLGIYSAMKNTSDKGFFDVQLALVTLKSGLVAVSEADKKEVRHGLSKLLPFFIFVIILAVVGSLGLFSGRYALANKTFQDSLFDASQNKGSDAYTKQSKAISLVPYNDAYQRVFSQTNLALANSLSNSTPKGASPSAQTQQTIYTLIQQSIASARSATTLSPITSANWQNLSGVYRALIGFGKNADSFSILAAQQAIALDPTNPQEYINLGGLYYQLQLWDKAAEQFRAAINLKPDFANAYYNLAHALDQKGDLKGALDQLEQVKTLVKNDVQSLKKVQEEIDALKKGLSTPAGQSPLGGATTLPPQNPPVAIPAPATPTPKPTPTPTPVPAPTP